MAASRCRRRSSMMACLRSVNAFWSAMNFSTSSVGFSSGMAPKILNQQMDEAGFQVLHELAFGGLRDETQVRADPRVLRDLTQTRNRQHGQQPPSKHVAPVVQLHN